MPTRRSVLRAASLVPILASGLGCGGAPQGGTLVADGRADDGRGDFDFLVGRWRARNRRLVARLRGSTEWQELDATIEGQTLPGAIGNLDTLHIPRYVDGEPLDVIDLKVFDPASRTWTMIQADSRSGRLGAPLVGRFEGGRGDFFGDDTFEGRPIRVRFRWSDITADRARWEQAFSPDGGETWETNWTMELRREESRPRQDE